MRRPEVEGRVRESWVSSVANSSEILDELIERYNEPHRFYHDLGHINTCLEELGRLGLHHREALPLYLALWSHDVIYRAEGNDVQDVAESAAYAYTLSLRLGHEPSAEEIFGLVLVTDHKRKPGSANQKLIADIDLAILGKEWPSFQEYETNIRREYAWVPESLFKQNRLEILSAFLERKRIYHTTEFQELYEAKARENLLRVIKELK